jgi:hypothetical protein
MFSRSIAVPLDVIPSRLGLSLSLRFEKQELQLFSKVTRTYLGHSSACQVASIHRPVASFTNIAIITRNDSKLAWPQCRFGARELGTFTPHISALHIPICVTHMTAIGNTRHCNARTQSVGNASLTALHMSQASRPCQ